MNERLLNPISDDELERRWAAVRLRMQEEKIDVLLMQGSNDFMGGYIKYFTDIPATNGYPVTVLFPRDAPMTVIGQGTFGMVQDFRSRPSPARRGVGRYLGTPSYLPIGYTVAYDAQLAIEALAPYAQGRIGVVGASIISSAFLDAVRRGVPAGTQWLDASEMVDRIKVEKSDAEIDRMFAAAAMQDRAWQAVLDAIRPGIRDNELAALAEYECRKAGSEQGLYLCASAPVGTAAMFGNRYFQNRVIQQGDYFSLLIESSGPGGYFTELGRTVVLGKASDDMRDEFGFVLEARKFTTDRLVPGCSGRALWEDYNAFMRANGRPEEKRLHCHGQGYDMVERPLMRHDESMTLRPRTVLACHPTYATATTFSWICDNYLVKLDGTTERLHRTPEQIFER
ncbi:hypothetical protein CDO46_00270 [Pigmentiphaga sp. NML030171]|uniref:M24 family metallopeptidase n=1 Tax=Pigmentiphaga sp. NML030171 TaxID=2008676 RepID=UPI000B411E10|nr:M24 family metallopeptidase [Pigmentiphaga sp. NML030171]OVZ66517.1 hypothetical protein CDO46_00270 [Pigmentiphaga sp. NML030171]